MKLPFGIKTNVMPMELVKLLSEGVELSAKRPFGKIRDKKIDKEIRN